MSMSAFDAGPIFPFEIFHIIIENIADMVFFSQILMLRTGSRDDDSEFEPCRVWHQTLQALTLVSKSFKHLSQPYLSRNIFVSAETDTKDGVWKGFSRCFPPVVKTLLSNETEHAKHVLSSIKTMSYRHQGWNEEPESDQSTCLENHLVSLPALEALYIDGGVNTSIGTGSTPDFDDVYDTKTAGFWTLLGAYTMGRPEGVASDDDFVTIMGLDDVYPYYLQPTPMACSTLVHLSLANIRGLPLVPLLTSPTLTSIDLDNCEFSPHLWQDICLYSDCSKEQVISGEAITLVPAIHHLPQPGFNIKRWKARGGNDLTPALLRYCTMLEHLDIIETHGFAPASARYYPVEVIHHSSSSSSASLPTRVPIPDPIPFQKVETMSWTGDIDMGYFCTLVEKRGDGSKLFPNLRELTLDGVYSYEKEAGTDADCGSNRVLIRHVAKLKILRYRHGDPAAINLAQVLYASSSTLEILDLEWDFRLDEPEAIFQLCEALDLIKGVNKIHRLEFKFHFHDVDPSIFLVELDDDDEDEDDDHTREAADQELECPWIRISNLLSTNPPIDFPFLQLITFEISFHLENGKLLDIDLLHKLQDRMCSVLQLNTRCMGGIVVKCNVAVLTSDIDTSNGITSNSFVLTLCE